MNKPHPKRAHLLGQIGMIGDHHTHRHVQLTATVAPQQIQQTGILGRRHDRHPLGPGRLAQPEIHPEPRRHPAGEGTLQGIARRGQAGQMKNPALHEHPTGLGGGILIQRHDIGTSLSQKRAHRRHQPRPIRTTAPHRRLATSSGQPANPPTCTTPTTQCDLTIRGGEPSCQPRRGPSRCPMHEHTWTPRRQMQSTGPLSGPGALSICLPVRKSRERRGHRRPRDQTAEGP
jgi:hypothetical protein